MPTAPPRAAAGRLERAVGPPEPVRQELLAADADLLEAARARELGEFGRRERVHVDNALERRVGRAAVGCPRRCRADCAAPQRRDRARCALWHGREAIAVQRRLTREQNRAARREHALELGERALQIAECGAAPRARARGRSSRRRTAAARRRLSRCERRVRAARRSAAASPACRPRCRCRWRRR